MSLINQVLRDLDRHARPTATLPAAVRAAVAAAAPWRRRAAVAVALSGLLALGGVLRLGVGPGGGFGVAEAALSAPATSAAAPVATALALTSTLASPSDDAVASTSAPWSLTTRTLLAAAGPPVESKPTRLRLDPGAVGGDAEWSLRIGMASTAGTAAVASASPGFPVPAAAAAAVTAAAIASAAAAAPDLATALAAVNLAAPPPLAPPLATPAPTPLPPAGPVHIEKRAIAIGPAERADAAFRLAAAAQQRGDYAEAASQYAAALHEDAASVAARVGLAGVRMAQSRPAEAEALLQAGLAVNPQQAALAMPLARLLAARGDLPTAIGVLQAGLPGAGASRPAQADYRACLGAVLQRAGQHHEAAEQFNAALRLAPANGVWWMGLAISLAADSRTDAARTAYQQALAVGGLSPELAQFVEQRLRQQP